MPSRTRERQDLRRRGPRKRGMLQTDPGGNPQIRQYGDSTTVVFGDGVPRPLPDPATGLGAVATDPAGALEGDGSPSDPLAVRVDGTTIQINAGNQLEAIIPTPTPVLAHWEPVSNGDPDSPEIVFADGDVVMVWVTD